MSDRYDPAIEECSLGEPTPHPTPETDALGAAPLEAASREIPVKTTPADVDLLSWIQGVRSARRAVTIYGRADLAADLDALAAQIAAARASAQPTEDLIRDALAVRDELFASALDVVVEERSGEALAARREQLQAAGVTDEVELLLHQLADQIVEPAGFTVDLLRQLHQATPVQVMAIAHSVRLVNTSVPQVDIPFLHGLSPSPETPTS